MTKSGTIVTIIVALIAITPAIVTFTNTVSPISQPFISHYFEENGDSQILIIKNTGSSPATNVTGIIISKSPTFEPKVAFSSIEIQSFSLNNTTSTLKIEIPEFPTGSGSLIKISIPKSNLPEFFAPDYNFEGYFIYDQGSNAIFLNLLGVLSWLPLILVIEIPVVFLISGYIISRKKVGVIVSKLFEIREELVNAINKKEGKKIKLDNIVKNHYKLLASIYPSLTKEYTAINDFEQLLYERNHTGKKESSYQSKNHSCLTKLDSILNQTDWFDHYDILWIFRKFFFEIKK